MEIWRVGVTMQPGMVVIKQFCCFPRLRQHFCTFCLRVHRRGLLFGRDYKGEQKAFLRGSNHSADPINQWQKQSCASCDVTGILTKKMNFTRMMTCCATIEAFIVSQGGRCGGTSVSNADLGVTERGIACQETPTLQPPPPPPFHSPRLPPILLLLPPLVLLLPDSHLI